MGDLSTLKGTQSNTFCSGFGSKNPLMVFFILFSTGTYAGIGTKYVESENIMKTKFIESQTWKRKKKILLWHFSVKKTELAWTFSDLFYEEKIGFGKRGKIVK